MTNFTLNQINQGQTIRKGFKFVTRVYQHDNGAGWRMNQEIYDREGNSVWKKWTSPRCE